MPKLILASGSPRRKEFLRNMGLEFTVEVADIDESIKVGESPRDLVMRLSRSKAQKVAALHSDAVVLGADTIVVIDNEILGKPKDREDAKAMILMLSGRTHQVYTAVCVIKGEAVSQICTITDVTFAHVSEALAQIYVDSGESDDTSGSYAVQGIAAMLIEKVNGSVSSVVGLPASQTRELLALHGLYPQTVKVHD